MARMWGAALAALALGAGPAHAACWNSEDVSAATVRELQSMLMVATLRCHAAGMDVAADYNEFLRANKVAIIGQNDRLKAHFVRAAGAAAGQRAYDSFNTSMANGYGAQGTSPELCANVSAIEREAVALAGSVDGLVAIAEREAMPVDLPGGRCGEPSPQMASASATRGIVAAAQPNATPMIAAHPAVPAIVRAVEPARDADAMPALAYIPGH